MSNQYLAHTQIIKFLALGLTNHFAALCATLFLTKGIDTKSPKNRVSTALDLHQMANEMDSLQPSLAAELRAFASRS